LPNQAATRFFFVSNSSAHSKRDPADRACASVHFAFQNSVREVRPACRQPVAHSCARVIQTATELKHKRNSIEILAEYIAYRKRNYCVIAKYDEGKPDE